MARSTLVQSTQTAVNTFTSGPITIAALNEIIIDIHFTAVTGGTVQPSGSTQFLIFNVSRVTPFGNLVNIGIVNCYYSYIGNTPTFTSGVDFNADLDHGFAQSIQVDMVNSNGATVSFQFSVVGN